MSIISEAQANFLFAEKVLRGEGNGGKAMRSEGSGEILNNTGTMEYDQTSKQLSITFRYINISSPFLQNLNYKNYHC